MLTLVVARARNGAIGRDNQIPWHSPEDLASFRRETLGGALIMGRRTWESLPIRPLQGRLNMVVSTTMPEGEEVVRSISDSIRRAQDAGIHRIYGIGGSAIYMDLLPIADRLLITEMDLEIPDADTFFPVFPADEWRLVESRTLLGSVPNCRINEFIRKA